MFPILSVDFERLFEAGEMKEESFNEHRCENFSLSFHSFPLFLFHFIYFAWGNEKVFHFAWLHSGFTKRLIENSFIVDNKQARKPNALTFYVEFL